MTRDTFINGRWQAGEAAPFTSLNPANGEVVWQGSGASARQVDAAVAAARTAFSAWARTSLADRQAIVEAFGAAMADERAALADTIARETGKLGWEAEAEAGAVLGKVGISIEAYHERTGQKEFETAFGHARLTHRPHGVMAVFGPYNFPAHLPNGHIIPALLAGNTVVFKPSELTPQSGEIMVRAWERAGLPAGVLNLVQGARETGEALLNADINGLLFTGSMETGTLFHRHFAGRPEILLALEMGGNNPLIAWDVADAEAAASLIIQSAFIPTGQRCTCARRLLLPEGRQGDEVLDALLAQTDAIRIGAYGDNEDAFFGPAVSPKAADAVLQAASAMAACGGDVLRAPRLLPRGDAFVTPGIVEMTLATGYPDRETFGPLLQVVRVASFDQAIDNANATAFGLSAGLISDDTALWERFQLECRAGIVNFNRPTTGAASALPFGGPGLSGNHRPSAYYAADYCAYPMASQVAPTPQRLGGPGLG